MWRSQTLRKGRQILTLTQRHLAAEAGGAAPNPPPPQPKSRGFGFVKFLGLGIPAATGGVVGYAWYDNDFRKQLEDNVPYAKEMLENVLPSDDMKSERAVDLSRVPAPIFESKSEISKGFPISIIPSAHCATDTGGMQQKIVIETEKENGKSPSESSKDKNESNRRRNDESPNIEDDNSRLEKDIENCSFQQLQHMLDGEENSQPSEGGKSVGLALEKDSKKTDAKNEPISLEQQLKNKEMEDRADNAALEVVIHKLLESGENWVSEAAKAQMDVAKTTKNHSTLLKKAMDESSNILGKDSEWESVTVAYREREIAVARANELVDEARRSIEKLKKVLDEAKGNKVTSKNSSIFPATKKLADFAKEMSFAGAQVRQADADAKVMLKYKDLVDKGRKQFQLELESLAPDVRVGGKGRKLTEEELNALIAHAHRRIEQLQKQIAEHLAMERKRLNLALEAQKEESKSLAQSAVIDERSRMVTEFELEKQKMEIEFAAWMEADVRKQLSRQAAAHSDHLKDVLAVQEVELHKDYERKINIKLLEEREKFQAETSGWISRLKGLEAAVDARAASEKLAHSAQDLWLACIALNSTIQFGNDEEDAPIPLQKQVDAMLASSNKHPFVQTVANTIPNTALDRGIYTENNLRDRFVKVSQVSRRLGLIQESNASLYQYLVSFLHSFFAVNSVAAYSEKDFVSISDMDNFKLVANAQYWMEKGNLDLAVRFMTQLTGESRKAAGDWITEARLLLETRQAAQTILTFASATGLAATF